MADTPMSKMHWKTMYADTVRLLSGSPDRSLLKEFVSKESKAGEIVYVDSYGPAAAATRTALASTKNRTRYDGLESPVLANWVAIHTPNMLVTKQRTQVTAEQIEWGHTFEKEEDLAAVGDPESRTMKAAMQKIWSEEDEAIIAAFGATVTRGTTTGSTESVAFTAGQTVEIAYAANGAQVVTSIFAKVLEKFDLKYLKEPILFVCSPWFKRMLITNSGGTIHSKDFVDPKGYFERGELPDIYGCKVIVHPQLQAANETTSEVAYAWTPSGMVWNEPQALTTNLGVDPGQRFRAQAYMEEWGGCSRIDDGRVVKITIDKEA